MPYIYKTIESRMLIIFMVLLTPFFYLTIQCDKLSLGHFLELS